MATCIEDFQKTVIIGDGVTTDFVVQGAASTNAASYRVDINGILQEPDTDYVISSNGYISFITAPSNGARVVVIADSTDGTVFFPDQPLQNISPNAPEITTILKTECIGNSLATINNNFANLKSAICTVDNFLAAANLRINQIDNILNNVSSERLAKAYVSFDATKDFNSVANLTNSQRKIIQSYKIDNVTRSGIGVYVVSFDLSTFTDTKYLMFGTAKYPNVVTYSTSTPTSENNITVQVMDDEGTPIDTDLVSLIFFNK